MAKRASSTPKSSDPAAPAKPKVRKPRAAAASAPPAAPHEPTLDEIRRRAYERYMERGGAHGAHFDDWVEAEKELRRKK